MVVVNCRPSVLQIICTTSRAVLAAEGTLSVMSTRPRSCRGQARVVVEASHRKPAQPGAGDRHLCGKLAGGGCGLFGERTLHTPEAI